VSVRGLRPARAVPRGTRHGDVPHVRGRSAGRPESRWRSARPCRTGPERATGRPGPFYDRHLSRRRRDELRRVHHVGRRVRLRWRVRRRIVLRAAGRLHHRARLLQPAGCDRLPRRRAVLRCHLRASVPTGVCRRKLTPRCAKDADCRDPSTGGDYTARCRPSDQNFERLVSPLTTAGSRRTVGAKVFPGAGRCIEDLGTSCDPLPAPEASPTCRHGAFCERTPGADAHTGTCKRERRVCLTDEDCPGAAICRKELLTATANDADGDEIPDAFDNCPLVPNVLQEDSEARRGRIALSTRDVLLGLAIPLATDLRTLARVR
jgi:hypothetical protein